MTDTGSLKGSSDHFAVSFEDLEDLRKGWEQESIRMLQINTVFKQMEVVWDPASSGLSRGLGTPQLHEFLAAHSRLVDLAKSVTSGASHVDERDGGDAGVFASIAKSLKDLGQQQKDLYDKTMRELAKLGVRVTPPTKEEVRDGYWRWRDEPGR